MGGLGSGEPDRAHYGLRRVDGHAYAEPADHRHIEGRAKFSITTGDADPVMTATAESPALEARNLYRFFRAGEEETLALRGVSLTVEPGTTVAVLGPSGSGKSTLLNCLAGLDEPDGGTVFVRGERVSHRPETERARIRARRIGVLLQTGNLLQHLDVRGNVRVAQLATHRARLAARVRRSAGTSRSRRPPARLPDGAVRRRARAGWAGRSAGERP